MTGHSIHPDSAGHVLAARGARAVVDALRDKHHIYMTSDSRMNLAGIMPHNVAYVADSIAAERFL